MMDRSRACSSLVALAIASVGVLSACEQGKSDDVTRTSRPLTTGLQAGDVAITCFDTQNTDSLQITPLVPLDANTRIQYTDREANADGVFNTNDESVDQVVTITSPTDAGTIPAGTPFTFVPTTGLNNGTEQVFLYQGHIGTDVDGGNPDAAVQDPNTQLIWGMQVSPAGMWVPRNDALNLSDLPTSLNGHALALSSSSDAGTLGAFYYDTTKGPTHGTKAVLQAAFENAAFWTSAAGPVLCSTVVAATFTVDPDVVDSGSDVPTGTGGAGGGDGGTAGMTGTTDASGADTGAGGATGDGAVADTGIGGTTGGDGSVIDAGVGGAGGSLDSGTDVKADTGTTDVKADTATDTSTGTDAKADTGTDAKVDTGTGTDAKVDTGTGTDVKPADAGKDSATTSSSSGCSCSTASNSQSLSASVSLLALAGIVMTARRRRRR